MGPKDLQLERMVFFCDAVVAIAITLLALDIKIAHTASGHITFADITAQWRTFAAFGLSFINIASFWKTHHLFFSYIKKIDERLLWFNIMWLFFIILLPFSTSLVSSYFGDMPAIFIYSLNILLIACFQNLIWDYPALRKKEEDYIKDTVDEKTARQMRLFCNLDMINAIIAIAVSFFRPTLAFVLLFTKLPIIVLVRIAYRNVWDRPERNKGHC